MLNFILPSMEDTIAGELQDYSKQIEKTKGLKFGVRKLTELGEYGYQKAKRFGLLIIHNINT